MKRRQRNKIAALPAEHRQLVIDGLLDGETYDAIRDVLRAHGVVTEEIPGNKAFKAYQTSEEYTAVCKTFRSWKQKTAQKSLLAKALEAGGGLSTALDSGLFQAYETLLENLTYAESVKDVTAITTAMTNLKRTALADELQQIKINAAKAVAAAKAKLEDEKGVEVSPEQACAVVQSELDRILGVKK